MTISILLSRKTINIQSGAGQMIVSQAQYLQDRGYDVRVCCAKFGRGAAEALPGIRHQSLPKALRLLLSSGMRERAYQARASRMRREDGGLLIDHGQTFSDPDIAYVHNFAAPQFADRFGSYLANEHYPWTANSGRTILIANSQIVRRALIEVFGLPDASVVVLYPGYDAARFNDQMRVTHRAAVRNELGIAEDTSLVGLVTSGNFEKRGLDRFLECFTGLRERHSSLRGLLVGGRHVPRLLASHPDYEAGRIKYRRVSTTPERYLAALDLVIYPARYEEFGIVVVEAMAMGVPVLTSTAVGASELLATASNQLVLDARSDDVEAYRQRATTMLSQSNAERAGLETSLRDVADKHAHDAHNSELAALVGRVAIDKYGRRTPRNGVTSD